MSPYELENLPHTLKRVRTQFMFVIRLEVMPLQVIGKTHGTVRRVGVIRGGEFFRETPFRKGAWRRERLDRGWR